MQPIANLLWVHETKIVTAKPFEKEFLSRTTAGCESVDQRGFHVFFWNGMRVREWLHSLKLFFILHPTFFLYSVASEHFVLTG